MTPGSELLNPGQRWAIHHGDCIERMSEMPEKSVDFSIFSPPFPALYAYTSEQSDIGNSEDGSDMKIHLSFFYRQLARIVKPGRVIVVHVAQIPRMKRSGGVGLFDFRGFNIRLGERAGLVYEYDWSIRKNPQAQALRTRSRELQFAGLESDRAKSRGALADYAIKFRAPGENAVPIRDWDVELDDDGDAISQRKQIHETQVSRNEWIGLAESHWADIRETDTLNTAIAKGENDTRHICALQLGLIEKFVRLFSNPDELVFSPFTGIGSELVTALKLGRRAYGCELKREYFDAACRNCAATVNRVGKRIESRNLFAGVE